MENSRNMILAILLSALVLFGGTYLSQILFPKPKAPLTQTGGNTSTTAAVTLPGVAPTTAATVAKPRSVGEVIKATARVAIATPSLRGSINLTGAVVDDLTLTKFHKTVKANDPIRLLSPRGTAESYVVDFGWTAPPGVAVPNTATVWQADGNALVPGKPVTLTWDNGGGLIFEQRFSIDENYLISVDQVVANKGTVAVPVRANGAIHRSKASAGKEAELTKADAHSNTFIHVGPIGVFNEAANYSVKYDDLAKPDAGAQRFSSKVGWLGFGETYWLTALVPNTKANFDASFHATSDKFQADFAAPESLIAPGANTKNSTRLFAGAKEIDLLNRYEADGVPLFHKAIDWGWFEIIEKPLLTLLLWLFSVFKNFGVAIIALTVIVRGLMFPVAQRQFESMARMRAVQPKLKDIQERYKDDKPRLQQEMMGLYKKEKINPMGGCLPIFLQMPIFYGLYKVLNLAVEMRHQPFALWLHDLSGPDPATILNLFGTLPFTPTGFFAIGVLPVLLGITMYLQFKLNPAPLDPVQQQVFAIMPWVMMIMMAPFAAGLQLYWTVSNLLTIAQQKWLYSRHPALKEPLIAPAAAKK